MINDKTNKQEGGDSSTNLQSKKIIINQGISYSDAKEIALDVYKSNFLKLSQDAAQVARERAEEITDDFLNKLKSENPSAINVMNDPSMQAALYEAQKQYAKTGDKELEGLLVDILVERISTPGRNIKQIVLDESITVASKLTIEQMDALTINFLIIKTVNRELVSLENIKSYLEIYLMPFISKISTEPTCYEHLEYVGCGSIMHIGGLKKIEEIYRNQYRGLFSKGFTKERLENEFVDYINYPKIVTTCLHDQKLFQINAINVKYIEEKCIEENIPEETKTIILNLYNSTTMSIKEIKEYIIEIVPEISKLFDMWDNSQLSKFGLTTVGISIAQANFKRRTGLKLNLGIWIKDAHNKVLEQTNLLS